MSTIDSDGHVAINIKISPNCCGSLGLEHGTVEYIGFLIKDLNFSMTVEMDAALISTSWTSMKWLLDTNPNLQLILSVNSKDTVNSTALLLVRNDIYSNKVLYNINGALYADFLDLASTAGSPLLYFGITPRDASDVIWSHNTDTWQLLNAATQGNNHLSLLCQKGVHCICNKYPSRLTLVDLALGQFSARPWTILPRDLVD